MCLAKHWKIGQVPRLSLPIDDTPMKVMIPGFGLAHHRTLHSFECRLVDGRCLPFCLSCLPSLSHKYAFQINKPLKQIIHVKLLLICWHWCSKLSLWQPGWLSASRLNWLSCKYVHCGRLVLIDCTGSKHVLVLPCCHDYRTMPLFLNLQQWFCFHNLVNACPDQTQNQIKCLSQRLTSPFGVTLKFIIDFIVCLEGKDGHSGTHIGLSFQEIHEGRCYSLCVCLKFSDGRYTSTTNEIFKVINVEPCGKKKQT